METSFDPVTHRYEINHRPVPNVTQILSDLIPGWKASDWYLERGQSVHACAALLAQGKDFDNDPQIDGQVKACRRFFAEVKPVVLSVEQAVYCEQYGFAGRLDLFAEINGKRTVVDFKASIPASWPYQVALYGIALCMATHGLAVELREDGRYILSNHVDLRLYKQGALALLTAYNIRRKCKIAEGVE